MPAAYIFRDGSTPTWKLPLNRIGTRYPTPDVSHFPNFFTRRTVSRFYLYYRDKGFKFFAAANDFFFADPSTPNPTAISGLSEFSRFTRVSKQNASLRNAERLKIDAKGGFVKSAAMETSRVDLFPAPRSLSLPTNNARLARPTVHAQLFSFLLLPSKILRVLFKIGTGFLRVIPLSYHYKPTFLDGSHMVSRNFSAHAKTRGNTRQPEIHKFPRWAAFISFN